MLRAALGSSWFIRYSGEKASPFGRWGHLTLEMPKCLLCFFSQVIGQQRSGVLGPGDPPSCWTLGKKALSTVLCGRHPRLHTLHRSPTALCGSNKVSWIQNLWLRCSDSSPRKPTQNEPSRCLLAASGNPGLLDVLRMLSPCVGHIGLCSSQRYLRSSKWREAAGISQPVSSRDLPGGMRQECSSSCRSRASLWKLVLFYLPGFSFQGWTDSRNPGEKWARLHSQEQVVDTLPKGMQHAQGMLASLQVCLLT